MKLRTAFALILAAPFLATPRVSSASETELQAVLASECVEHLVSVTAFVHPSRHGMWISNDPGLNGKGIVILLKEADTADEGVRALIHYGRNHSQQQAYAFKATFHGVLKCSNSRKPKHLLVRDVHRINLMPVRDAATFEEHEGH